MSRRLRLPLALLLLAAVPSLCSAATYNGNVALSATGDPDAYGSAALTINNNNLLTATIEVFRLDASGTFAAHLHNGTCSPGAGIFLGLPDVTVDASGHAVKTLSLQLTASQASALISTTHYVDLHATSGTSVVCGNVQWGITPVEPATWGRVKALYR